jgi:type II secretory pathway pseudopilin PulG
MNYELRTKKGLTLTEMTVVIATVAMLTALSMPAVRTFFYSMSTSSGTKALISASLSSARAIAAREQRYAGIRFQKAGDPNNVLDAPQYMIFIVYDPNIPHGRQGNLGCRAVEGIQPIKLSDSIGVMDLYINDTHRIAINADIDNLNKVMDTTTFSIIFSPSGKLVRHSLWVRNRDGAPKWPNLLDNSQDDIFNAFANVSSNRGMFLQDKISATDLQIELSRDSFIIYEKDKFNAVFLKGKAFSDYLSRLVPEMIRINPYTGTIINEQ